MTLLRDLTIAGLRDGLKNKKFSALELIQAYFAHIRETDPKIRAYLSLREEDAAREAEAVDLMIAKDEPLPALAGVPLAIKDNILVKGHPATAASRILEHYVAAYDATVIEKLKSEKAVFLGKTNHDEFGMGSSTENSAFQITKNPHDPERVSGGSSGGSAAAVAAHMALAALGSDTGGSVRQPAAFCGVVGLKPTYGAVSRHGLMAMAASLNQIGPITRTVEDVAIVFNVIKGCDPMDAASSSHDYGDELANLKLEETRSLTVGIPDEYFIEGLNPLIEKSVLSAVEDLQKLGVKFKKISLPHTKYALSTYYIICPAEVSADMARFDGIRYARGEKLGTGGEKLGLQDIYFRQRALFGAEVKRRIILGTFVLSSGYYDAYYRKAQQARALIRQDFDEAFKEVQVILTPITPGTAFKIGEKVNDPLSMYLEDIYTVPVNLAGLPALSLPVRGERPLPIGFQLIGRPFKEADILGVGRFYERIGT